MCISENEKRICKRKKTYPNFIQAETWAKIINEKYKEEPDQRPYKCPVCGKYHLTCGSS